MPGGGPRSLASPVVSGVLCQCGGVATATSSTAEGNLGGGGGSSLPSSPSSLADPEPRLRSLFLQLDVNRDGALCVHDLAVGLQRLGLHRSERDLRSLATILLLVFSCVICLPFSL